MLSYANISLEKFGKDKPKKLLHEYLPNFHLRDRINYQRTWLPELADEKRAKMKKMSKPK